MAREFAHSVLAVMKRNWQWDSKYLGTYVGGLLWPAVRVLIMAFLALFVSSAASAQTGYSYIDYLIVGTIIWTVLEMVFFDTSRALRREQYDQTLEGIYLSPRGRNSILVGNLLYSLIFSSVTIIAIVLLSAFAFGFQIAGNPLEFLLMLLLSVYSITGLALVVNALTLLFKEAHALSFAVLDVLVLFSGIYYPTSVLPKAAQAVSAFSPLSYAFEIARQIALNGASIFLYWKELAIMLLIATALLAIGIAFYLNAEKRVLQNQGLKEK